MTHCAEQLALVAHAALERVAEDFADGRGQRVEVGLGAGREAHRREALAHALAGEVVLDAVGEDEGDEREAEGTARAHHGEPGRAVELALDGHGDLLLDLLRGVARVLGDDLRRRVGDVGVRLDGELLPGEVAEDAHQQEDREHQPTARERARDQPVDHWSSTALRVTTRSPARRPSVMAVLAPSCAAGVTRRRAKTHGAVSTNT